MDSKANLSLIVSLFLVVFALPAQAQTELPEMELRVTEVKGKPEINPDTASEWSPVKTGRRLKPGDRIRTGKDEIVQLEVPSVTFSRVTESSLIEVEELNRSQEERGLLTTETVVVNNIRLNELRGKVQNSLKKHEGVATDYELKTPNAVAGVRGTNFQCEVTTFGRTECAVLEGEVRFSSLRNPDASVSLGAGQQSSIGQDEESPSEPGEISDETREELQQVRDQAQTALRLKPTLSSVELNGNSFEKSISIVYNEQVELTVSGEASAPEDGAKLNQIEATVNGENRIVDGLSDWSLNLEPEVPAEGEQSTVEITLRAVDSLGSQSGQKTLRITLVNQADESDGDKSRDGVIPTSYESGQVDVEMTSLVGQSPGDLEFPYYLYRPDAAGGGITLQGQASGNAAIENVAYSIDRGNTWELAQGSENWTVDLPEKQGEFTILLRAWTVDGVIGPEVEIGPINYQPVSYEQAMRETFEGFWTAFERKDAQEAVTYLHPDFLFEPEGTTGEGGEEQDVEDKSGFQDFLQEQFDQFLNLRVFYSINTIFGNPNGGNLLADPIEWKLKAYDRVYNQYFPAAVTGNGDFKFRRLPNGQYKMLAFEGFRPTFFIGFDNIAMNDLDGYNQGSQEGVEEPEIHNGDTFVQGWLVAGFDGDRTLWPGAPARFHVNPSSSYDNFPSFCVDICDGPVSEGGIYRTPYSSFDEVNRIPDVGSNDYQNSVRINEGDIYAVNMVSDKFNHHITYLMKVLDLRNLDSDPYPEEVRFQVVSSGGEPTRLFNGANPFE